MFPLCHPCQGWSRPIFSGVVGFISPPHLHWGTDGRVLALDRCLLFTFPLRQGPALSPVLLSLSFKAEAQCPQVQRKPYKWKLAFVFELLTCSHSVLRPAKFLLCCHVSDAFKTDFCILSSIMLSSSEKYLGCLIYYSLKWTLLWWLQLILFLISVVTSRCFSPRVTGPGSCVIKAMCSLYKQIFPKPVTYYFLKLLYLLIANVGVSCSSLNG